MTSTEMLSGRIEMSSCSDLLDRVSKAADKLHDLQSLFFEIQEARHTGIETGNSTIVDSSGRNAKLKLLLHQFDSGLDAFSHILQPLTEEAEGLLKPFEFQVPNGIPDEQLSTVQIELSELQSDWADLLADEANLRDELNEDKWLEVLWQTFDSAKGMMDSLQRAIDVVKIAGRNGMALAQKTSLEDINAVLSSYDDKRKFYVPSVEKACIMIGRGLGQRLTTNGVAIRKHVEMTERWKTIKATMLDLDQDLLALRTHRLALTAAKSEEDAEVLLDVGAHQDNRASAQGESPSILRQHLPSPLAHHIPDAHSLSSLYSDDNLAQRPSPHPSTNGRGGTSFEEQKIEDESYSATSSTLGSVCSGRGDFRVPRGAFYETCEMSTTRPRDPITLRSAIGNPGLNQQTGARYDSTWGERSTQRLRYHQNVGSETAKIQTPTRIPRPPSPAGSSTSVNSSASYARRKSLIPVASPTTIRRQPRSDHNAIPPVPGLPDRTAIAAMERASTLRSIMQTPEPTLRMRATEMPFYTGTKSVVTPSRINSSAGTSYFSPSRSATPLGQRRSSAASSRTAPSAWNDQRNPRPSTSMSNMSRSGAMTPLPPTAIRKRFVPNPLDLLDVELAKILESTPNDVIVERLDPPLRRGQRHEGEWTAQYAFTSGRHGRQVFPSRLLELHKPRAGVEGKTRKIMVRTEGLWRDLRLVLLELA